MNEPYSEVLSPSARRGFELHRLLAEVAQEFGVTTALMRGSRRSGKVPAARAEFCRRAWALEVYSAGTIAHVLNKDHTAVLYYVGTLSRKPGGRLNRYGTALKQSTEFTGAITSRKE